MAFEENFPSGQEVDVYVTYVHDESANFFVQINNEEAGKLDELMAEIEEYVLSEPHGISVGEIEAGRVYLAQFSEDARWYRARVIAVKSGLCEVNFIDYGNSEQIPVKFVRKPKPSFLTLPQQAFECELDGISKFRGTHFTDAIATLSTLILEQELTCVTSSLNTGVMIVNLFQTPGRKDSILSKLLSQVTRTPKSVNQNVPGIVPTTKRKYQTMTLHKDAYLDFYVTDVRDPYSFSCQLVKNTEAILELMDAIATDYDNLSECECPLLSSDTGFPCCARFLEDECWYRAVITSSSSVASGFLDVKFVDYGNSQKTAVSEVRGLKDKFLDFPAQALESALHGIRPGSNDPEWSDDAKALFSKLTLDKHIVALICDQDGEGKCQVKLVDTTGEMDMQVDQILIAAKYAEKKADHLASVPKPLKRRDEPPSIEQTPPLRNNMPPENKTPVPFPYSKEEIVPGKEEEVLISVTKSPSSFYVMLYRSSAKLEKLMSDIKRHYARLGPDDEWIASPAVGDPCCAKFPEDNCWYRAIITDLLSSGKVEVLFIDYGNTEKITSKSIKQLAPKFSELPCQGIECLLNRICPNGKEWSKTDIKKFEDLALHLSGKLTVVAQESNSLRRVEMVISNRGKEINLAEAMLLAGNARLVHGATTLSENLASVVSKKFTKIGVTLGPYEDVFVSHVEDPANFWCQLCKHKEELDAIMNALEEYCSSTSNAISAPTLGLACCAQFNDDQGWYRATITGIQRNRQIEVQFIDFGNYDKVPPTNLRDMKPEFMNLPAQAFKCRLEQIDTKNSIPFPPAVIDQFFELTLEKELVGMITAHNKELDQYLVLLNQTVDGNTVDIFDVIAPLMPQKSTKEITVPKQELPIGRKEHVCVTTVTGMSNFYCQLMSSASKLDAMMVAMDTHYQTLKPEQEQLSQPKTGSYCVAEYSEDCSWYRAKIIDVNQGNFNLLYVDFGNGEILPSTKIKKLSSKFAELPEQVISCTLSADTTQFLDSQFVELTLDKEFDMVIVSVDTNNIAEVDLFNRKTTCSLTKSLTSVQPESNLVIADTSLSVGERVSLYVTSASSLTKFYCQVSQTADLLADIMDQIHNYYSSLGDNQDVISSPRVGLYCVAKFGEDDGWYRGLVTAVDGSSVEVFYVDYGNSEVLSLSRIKKLKPEFGSLPAQAVKCKLSIGNIGSAEASAKFLQLVEDPEVLYDAKVISMTADGFFEVELSKKETGESINEQFVEEEVVPLGKAYKPFDTAFSDNFIDISTSMCYNPHDFYCQVLSEKSIVSLAQLMAQLQDVYCNMSEADNLLNKPEVGTPCCTAYAGDNLWYRGIVTKVLDGSTVKVRFVDYGNEETVPMNQIKRLLPEFLDLPIQSICCCLPAIGPVHGTQWSSEASNRFSELVDQKQLVAKLISKGVEGKINFELYDTNDDSKDVNIAEFLVNENLAVWVSSSAEDKQAQPLCKTLSSLGKLQLLSRQVVFLTAVDSPEKIYCQFCGTEERLENVMTKLAEFYESPQAEKCVARDLSPGELCVALFSEDEAWYRATVESISSDNVTVRFLDYGNTETMNINNIRELSQEFLAEDVLAVECKLSDVRPLGGGQNWSSEATDFLSSLGGEDGFVVEVVIAGEVPEIRLSDKDGDVSERLVNKGLAESKRRGSKPDKTVQVSPSQASQVSYHSPGVDIGSNMGVYVTDITSLSKFYCQIADCGGELNEMMDSIYNHYSKLDETEGSLVSPVAGQPCVAIFEDDGSWYRAVVQSVSSSDLEIQFVDYGNSQKVKPSKAKLMEPRFAKPPLFAIECSLDSRRSDWTSDDVNKFKAVVGEDKLTAKIIRKENTKYIVRLFQGDDCISDPMLNKTAQCKLEIPNLPIQPGLDENVYVVYALSSTEVCLQLSQHSDSLDEVMNTIDHACRSDTTLVKAESLKQGAPCCALFEEGWYRAVVTSAPSSGHVEVEYIDYGNKATVPLSGLMSMPESCFSLPKQAIHCSLDSPGMSGVTKDMLEATLMDKQLQAKFIKHVGHCWSVVLKEDGVDVTDVLVISSELDTTKAFNELDIVANSSVQVYVSHTVNLLEFYLQKSSSTEELGVMGSRLNALYSVLQPTQDVLQNLDIGAICCAQFSEDQSWYRSVITSVINEMHVQVQFVDYGNSDVVEKSKLKVLMDEFMDVPVLAVQSSLDNPGATWTSVDIEKFEALAYDQELSAEFLVSTGKTWQVRLTKDGTSLVQLMRDNGEAVVVSQENLVIKDPILSTGQVLECAVSYVGQGEFYVQLLDVTLLDKVVHMISEVYPSLSPSDECLSECKVGSFCCVKFLEDQEWYRGVVTELLPDTQAKVLFIDYGNSDVVAIPSIKKLCSELFDIPKLAIPCRLADAKHNWSEADDEVLEAKMLDQNLQVTLVQAAQNGWNVIVEVEGIILNNLPCFTGLAKKKAKSFSVACLALNTKQPLKFLMAESLGCIWLQPMTTETELTTLMNNIAESKPTENLSEVSLGLPCLCKFTEDDEWYRAEVTGSQGENVSVKYVDYGNTESVGISRINSIQEAFLHLPAQAVKCKLFDIPESNTGFIVDKLNEEYVELPMEVEVFQQDEADVYMVKLFDEDGTALVPKLIDAIVTTKEPVAAVMNNCEESEVNGVKLDAEKVLAEGKVVDNGSLEVKEAHDIPNDCSELEEEYYTAQENRNGTSSDSIAEPTKKPLDGSAEAVSDGGIALNLIQEPAYDVELKGKFQDVDLTSETMTNVLNDSNGNVLSKNDVSVEIIDDKKQDATLFESKNGVDVPTEQEDNEAEESGLLVNHKDATNQTKVDSLSEKQGDLLPDIQEDALHATQDLQSKITEDASSEKQEAFICEMQEKAPPKEQDDTPSEIQEVASETLEKTPLKEQEDTPSEIQEVASETLEKTPLKEQEDTPSEKQEVASETLEKTPLKEQEDTPSEIQEVASETLEEAPPKQQEDTPSEIQEVASETLEEAPPKQQDDTPSEKQGVVASETLEETSPEELVDTPLKTQEEHSPQEQEDAPCEKQEVASETLEEASSKEQEDTPLETQEDHPPPEQEDAASETQEKTPPIEQEDTPSETPEKHPPQEQEDTPLETQAEHPPQEQEDAASETQEKTPPIEQEDTPCEKQEVVASETLEEASSKKQEDTLLEIKEEHPPRVQEDTQLETQAEHPPQEQEDAASETQEKTPPIEQEDTPSEIQEVASETLEKNPLKEQEDTPSEKQEVASETLEKTPLKEQEDTPSEIQEVASKTLEKTPLKEQEDTPSEIQEVASETLEEAPPKQQEDTPSEIQEVASETLEEAPPKEQDDTPSEKQGVVASETLEETSPEELVDTPLKTQEEHSPQEQEDAPCEKQEVASETLEEAPPKEQEDTPLETQEDHPPPEQEDAASETQEKTPEKHPPQEQEDTPLETQAEHPPQEQEDAASETQEKTPPIEQEDTPCEKQEVVASETLEEASSKKQEDTLLEMKEEHPPREQEDTQLETQEEHPPIEQEDTPSETQEEHPPIEQEDTPSETQEEHPPIEQEDTPSETQEEHPPQEQEDTPLETQEEHPPQEHTPLETQEEHPPPEQEDAASETQEKTPPQEQENTPSEIQ